MSTKDLADNDDNDDNLDSNSNKKNNIIDANLEKNSSMDMMMLMKIECIDHLDF
jgi:hypothetical protein